MNLGVIPGRLNSTRFPKKIVYQLNGKSVIQHVYDNAKESKLLNHLVIAIDSMETLSHLNKECDTVLTSKGHESGTDRVAEVAGKIKCNIVVNIQGDEPNIDANLIDSLISLFDDPSVEMASVASSDLNDKDLKNPNVVKVCLDKENNARSFERAVSDKKLQYFRHIGIYAYRKATLEKFTNLEQSENEKKLKLEQLRALDNNIAIKLLISDFQHRSIDVKEDLKYYEI
ncbi:3-deoxy-manno-octulosonate cytidylyltransferase [Candidatus Marinimicrobia bacterium]|nr:3-deoxy-manno-octulosonate cytidylyltransferase [Candidatus Neomarinimicrobiota bacterium]MDA9841086.1 3-deoxy-manno-octulosonate cytidylyltransferase [Candidatus Neomarinimicrobiota bacterium]MDC0521307.1 3-deoxy-manno-octulosonate cytidylyltransferase [Candidatus Neomarinimicrobiota bacterium]MDC0878813.1 3-deoxy-manno-octulosonate cytidylyltransferase [Candidatus Neomarinimicrobiota bacterium]MDC1000820.1 3-deoxy-manno-octulosonate cytidylyltransferase [Candidatus Neomarinimicrobiota bact